ncbi:DUF4232 domain-containing protein [Allokutzneria sp. A3M-2-11 16]|uniref:DUF4232 domain-containing protein n=1 Tax=Allokutzneria sp. A3M-2-11 16 TaxID=2962043 RepID=UPI0020B63EC6|nr:DUF4232 domain-containing protein [Allokutzneria sp. A3M-2-11 16]MCP3801636.1 DUF4232 domain-containing protein [Allokutzneria sp. A3M-2-11 16]
MSSSLRRGLVSAAAVATACGAALTLAAPAQAAPIGAAQCGAKDLNVTARYNDAGMGKAYWRVEFASNGATCTLQGTPTDLLFADAKGRALNLAQETGAPEAGEAVTVAPGEPAHVLVRTRLEGERLPATKLLLTLPNSEDRVETAWPEAIAGPVGVTEVRTGE